MKKIMVLLIVVLSLSACASNQTENKDESKEETKTEQRKTTESKESDTHMEVEGAGEEVEARSTGEEKINGGNTISFSEDSISVTFSSVDDYAYTNGETYGEIEEEGYKQVITEPLSTFSIDVDTASYSNIRRYINDYELPPVNAVKIEEMVNYFDYNYSEPKKGEAFSITTEVGVCPWNEESHIAMIGLQGLTIELDERPKTNIVFLLDVSGSMDNPDKLPLLKEAFSMMVEELGENDRVSIVVYAGASGTIIDGITGDQKDVILRAIRELSAGGSTAGSEGIELAYELAKKHFISNGNNRVILATDGDFNVGLTSNNELMAYIEKKREEDIFLSVLGFGTGNTNFETMETLADTGNGFFAYIDTQKEAEKVLVNELSGTLYTIAKDVKIQVEFNPNVVQSYRLIGYENRRLDNEDFVDDRVDAGDIGAGHRVTALYELKLVNSIYNQGELRYQSVELKDIQDEIMFVKIRYKQPDSDRSRLIELLVKTRELEEEVSDDYKFATAVAEFGLLLRESEYRSDASFKHIYTTLIETQKAIEDEYKLEFLQLVTQAENLMNIE